MQANNASAPRLRLRKAAFDAAADKAFGADATDTFIAAQLGVDKSTLSLYRCGHRSPTSKFLAAMNQAFAGISLDDLTTFDDNEPEVAA